MTEDSQGKARPQAAPTRESRIALTREVGAFIAGMRFESLPREAVTMACNGITDSSAVMILGRGAELVHILRTALDLGAPEARLVFGAQRASAPSAALVNGAAAHALDYDDIGLNSLQPTHPSAVLAPAVFAEAEALGRSGRDAIAAYATGFEVWGELASRERTPPHVKGWHPTATFGAVAAAAAAAKLRGLDAKRAAHAVGIAASQAGGLVANFGSMTKPFHAGRAASAGVLSARLAAAGMTASADALEHPQGFLAALAPAGEIDVASPVRLGKHWWLVADGLGFKLYPMCYGTHRALDGAIALAREHDIAPGAITGIETRASRDQLTNLVQHDPQSGLEAKFSLEFALAMAFIARRATLAELEPEFVHRADVRELMKKVRITLIESPEFGNRRVAPDDGVIVTLADGTRLERRFDLPRGHPQRPVGADTLWEKFADCTRGALRDAQSRRLFELLQNLEALRSISEIPFVVPETDEARPAEEAAAQAKRSKAGQALPRFSPRRKDS